MRNVELLIDVEPVLPSLFRNAPMHPATMDSALVPIEGLRLPQALARGLVLVCTFAAAFAASTFVYSWPVLPVLEAQFPVPRLLPYVLESTMAALLAAAVIGVPTAITVPRHAMLATSAMVAGLVAIMWPEFSRSSRWLVHLLGAYQLGMLVLCPLAATQAAARRFAIPPAWVRSVLHAPWVPLATYVGLFAWLYLGATVLMVAGVYVHGSKPGPLSLTALNLLTIGVAGAGTTITLVRRNRRALTGAEHKALLVRSSVAAVVIQTVLAIPKFGLAVLSPVSIAVAAGFMGVALGVLAVVYVPARRVARVARGD